MNDISMAQTLAEQFAAKLNQLNPRDELYAVQVVDSLLALAREWRASDLHLIPEDHGGSLRLLLRIDGVLQPLGRLDKSATNVISRLKVLANLLTYRMDIPQEGRIRTGEEQLEMRLSTFPTVHGEKAVVRMFVGSGQYLRLADLGLPARIESELSQLLLLPAGLIIVCGPAGSGKTTTLYAAMRHILEQSVTPRSLCTLEDPVEALLPGISQSQVKPEGEFTYQRGLASLMRQDPEVIMVGEIRDAGTAEIVFQASLTGQLVLTSFHSSSSADAISRLSDMGIEPYVLRSGLLAILAQRLLRRACDCRTGESADCELCRGTGYHGRIVVAELLQPDLKGLGRAILDREDAQRIEELAVTSGMKTLIQQAAEEVASGRTTEEEFTRVFGPGALPTPPVV